MTTAAQPSMPAPGENQSQGHPAHSTFLRIDVLACCHEFGQRLHVPAGLVGWRVMAAIASVESSMGANCGPRHEPSYDVEGRVWRASEAQQDLVAEYPSPASAALPSSPGACSYGPWQLMLVNCPGSTPDDLITNLDCCAEHFVEHFNGYVMAARHASSLEEIGEVWNLGHVGPDPAYVGKLSAAYNALG